MTHVVVWNNRWLMYILVFVAPTALLELVGAYIARTSASTAPSFVEGEVTFAALSVLISMALYLTIHAFQEEKTFVKEYVGEDALVSVYQRMKREAVSECFLTWMSQYKVTNLRAYFDQEAEFMEKCQGKAFRRIIGLTKTDLTPEDILLHFERTRQLRMPDGRGRRKYDCRVSRTEGVEMVYADFHGEGGTCHRALLIAADGDEKIGFAFEDTSKPSPDASPDAQRIAVNAMRSFFLSEWETAMTEEDYRRILTPAA